MKKQRHWISLLIYFVLSAFLTACTKDFDEHYRSNSELEKNIVQVLEEDGRFSSFVEIIDELGLRETLGEAAIYTCLAPADEHVRAYLESRGYASAAEAPEEELLRYVNYHFINGMYYVYDLEKRYLNVSTELAQTRATYYKTRITSSRPGKSIRIFTSPFFDKQQDDYRGLYQAEGTGFMVESARISESDHDIDANNGVIHVLEDPLVVLPRTDEALAADPETSIFSQWLEKHVQYTLGEKDEFGWVDTTLYKSYTIGRNLADENRLSTLLVPTNEAVLAYFEPYMEEDLYNTIDSLPQRVMYSLLRSSVIDDIWFKGDLERNDPEWRAFSLARIPRIEDVSPLISGSVPASNSVIYKVNKLIESPEMHSVEGGVYMKSREYSQWYWMFESTDLEAGLTDPLNYQHGPKTVLLQPDEFWGFPLAEDMNKEDLERRLEACRTGIINLDVRTEDGFRKRYYPTEFGYILYDDGRFYDYTGNSVSLLSGESVWERSNGTIYEIDGFLNPLDKTDTTLTVYSLMRNDPELSVFTQACVRAGLATELNLTGFFTYTVLAPTDEALMNAGVDPGELSETELLAFVNTYIIPNRYIFSDGVFNGQIPDKNGAYVTVSGAWDGFAVTGASGNTVTPVTPDIQGSNGMIHKVGQVL